MNQQLDQLNTLIKSSVCEHTELEYEVDYEDGYPYVVAAQCVNCGKDVTDTLSDAELAAAEEDAVSSRYDDIYGYRNDEDLEHV